MKVTRLLVSLFIVFSAPCITGYNILGIFHFPARSTVITFAEFLKKMSEKGHNVTVISNVKLTGFQKNYRNIVLDGIKMSSATDFNQIGSLNPAYSFRQSGFMQPTVIGGMSKELCKLLFSSKEVQELIENNAKFDIVMVHIFQSECVYQIARKFNCPIVGLHSTLMISWTENRFALPNNPAYIPSNFLAFSNKMNFLERVVNTLVKLLHHFYYKFVLLDYDKEVVTEYFGSKDASDLESLGYNTSIFLVNIHHTVNLPRPMNPSVIEVGGIHIGQNKTLPKNLEKWIKESPHGVIYFSFGSLVKGYTMPADKRQAFINAFKRLPQRVIWKWENDTMEGKSDNIMIGKWLPQFDILSHPNVKAFISHGGLLGTFEAVHCGVPILVMPQFGDQHTNAKAIESVGGGEILYLSDATEEKIYNALTKILSPSFQQQAKELSERFRDRPMPPLETAIYWVEYVARHKGAHFMKTAAVGMPFYQYYLLDVIAFLLAVLILFLYLVYLVLRFFVRLVFKPKQPTKVKKS